MNRPLRIAKQFYRDLDKALVYLDDHANESVVARFAAAVASTRTHIRTFPESGNLHYSAVVETADFHVSSHEVSVLPCVLHSWSR